MSSPSSNDAPSSTRSESSNTDQVAGVISTVAAITEELASPQVTQSVNAAMYKLSLTQSLATAIQDAVTDLRANATTQLAAVGAAASQLVKTGDVQKWEQTVNALQLATNRSQERLVELITVANQQLARAPGNCPPDKN